MTQAEFEAYFKDKINWKEFNYITSILTKYEDTGIDFELSVLTYCKYEPICMYNTDIGFRYVTDDFRSRIKEYEEEGLCYCIWDNDFSTDVKYHRRVLLSIKDKLKDKFIPTMVEEDDDMTRSIFCFMPKKTSV